MPFFWGKTGIFVYKKNQERKAKKKKNKKPKKQKQKENKEGLGPSEVALWATSPDP